MRKMEVIYRKDEHELVKEVNNMFQKAERIGYRIIATHIIKEPMAGYNAFIEYETNSDKK